MTKQCFHLHSPPVASQVGVPLRRFHFFSQACDELRLIEKHTKPEAEAMAAMACIAPLPAGDR